ncbi:MFS transporter [Streptacidiphilus carbonis]|uniref:MFS transporter n=1 Tax=Streptacidiphilus carbonis TaxID=105422 RepID=UPI000693A17E|nr:MFS transporter [Streptacidiphilus carbonis]
MVAEATAAADMPTGVGATLTRIGRVLRRRDFRWWFGSQVLGASGAATQAVALSWVVLQSTGNAFWLSVMTTCTWGPMLALGPWAGSLVDRHDRRQILLVTQSLLLVGSVALGVLVAVSQLPLWIVLGMSLLAGSVTAVDAPARQVYIVDLVGREGVASAVGLWEVVINSSRVLGPAVGGLLLATAGPAWCFLVNGLTFLGPLLVLWRLQPQSHEVRVRAPKQPGAIRSGLRYGWRTPVVRACLPMAAASGMLFTMGIALTPLATRSLHLGGGGYGALMAMFGIGALPGALLAAGTSAPTGTRVRSLCVATGASVLVVAWSPDLVLTFAAMALTGFTSIWFIATANTLVQLRTEPGMLGRVMGLWSMALPGATTVTGFLISGVVESLGARAGFSCSGVALLLSALLGWRALAQRSVDRPADTPLPTTAGPH